MSDTTPRPTPAAVAAFIKSMSAAELMTLAGELTGIIATDRAATIGRAEIKRRAGLLLSSAEPTGKFGRIICPVCGAIKENEENLRKHLIRQHGEHLADMPAEKFTRRASRA